MALDRPEPSQSEIKIGFWKKVDQFLKAEALSPVHEVSATFCSTSPPLLRPRGQRLLG